MLSGELTARVNELFRSGATIRVRVPGKKSPQNFRVIMYLPETQRVHLHPLSWTADRSAVMPRGYPVNRLLESKPHLIDDPVRTSLMESAEEHIPMERRDARDHDWSLIAPLVHPTPPKLPTVVGINLPKPQPSEPSHDLILTTELLTNLQTQVSQSH